MTEPITPAMAGCWVSGHQGWRGTSDVVRIAQGYGMPLTDDDETELAAYEAGDSTSDVVFDMADDAESYLNERAPDGHSFGWHDGEFFLMPHDWWDTDV